MYANPEHKQSGLRDKMTHAGLSVVVNACLFVILIRAFSASGIPAQKYMSVELQLPAQAVVHSVVKPQIKQIVLPGPAQPVPQTQPKPIRQSVQPNPSLAVLPSKQEMHPLPVRTREAQTRTPALSFTQPDPGPSRGSGGPLAPGGSGGVAGSGIGTGPGAYVNPGNGGGTGGSGTGTASSGHGAGDGHAVQPAQVHENRPPAPAPPKPAPKGESRDALLSHQMKPAYPQDAREEGAEGTVMLDITVSEDGRVTSARVDKGSGDRRLDRAAVEAVQKWTYEPCLKDGVPVASSMRVRVEFHLR